MDTCFGIVRPHQHGTASKYVLGFHMMNINAMKNSLVMGCGCSD